MSKNLLAAMNERFGFIVEHLAVTELPVSKEHHHDGSELQDLKGTSIEFVVHQRWLPVPISKLKLLRNEQVDYTKQRYGEKEWKN